MTVLRELLLDSRDGEWGKGEPFDGGHRSSVIRGTDFGAARMGDVSNVPIRVLEERHLLRKTLAPNDIIIETAGGTKDQPTGRTLHVTERLLNALPHPAVCASFARFLRIDPTKADPGFLFWLLQDHYQRRELLRFHTQHTGVARFQFTTFADTYEFQLPGLEIQRSVADMLFAYDELIEVNHRRIAIFEDMARLLFDEWFVRFRYPGHEAVPLVETDLGMVPKGWKPRALSWWTEEIRDTISPRQVEPLVAYVGLEHLPRRSTTLMEIGRAQDVTSSKLKFEAGDILFGKIRPYFHKVALMPFSGVCSTDAICIRPTNSKRTALILGLTSSDAFVAHAVATSNGTKMPRADWKVLKNYPLPEPPEPLLEAFEQTVHPMAQSAANLASQSNRLRAARDLLLPKLVSGEIDVSAAEVTFAEAAE